MSGNGGFITLEPFQTKFKFHEGTRQLGMARSQAGATVSMSYNEAMMAQAQGWGEVQLGRRPHDARPHLKGTSAPVEEMQPADGLSPQERARLRVSSRVSGAGADETTPSHSSHGATFASGGSSAAAAAVPPSAALAPKQRDAQELQLRGSLASTPLCVAPSVAPSATPSLKPPATRSEGTAAVLPVALPRGRVPFKLGEGTLYVGPVDASKRPRGEGALLLSDGAQHVGCFCEGRAEGAGCYLTSKGLALIGVWQRNKKEGNFVAIGANGQVWLETYRDGQRTSREKAAASIDTMPSEQSAPRKTNEAVSPTAPIPITEVAALAEGTNSVACSVTVEPAHRCDACGQLFHAKFDHPYACRRHPAAWRGDGAQGAAGTQGSWACCRARVRSDPGCELSAHGAGE